MYKLHCTTLTGAAFVVFPSAPSEGTFQEWGKYVLHLEHVGDCVLVVDDVELPVARAGRLQSWEWQPGFFAGKVRAELFDLEGLCLATYCLEVVPAPGKLGKELFKQMVDELFSSDPQLLFGEEAAQSMVGGMGDYGDPHLEYARLKMFGPKLLLALERLCEEPIAGLCRERRLVPPQHVRRIDTQGARALVRAPRALAAVRRLGAAAAGDVLFDVPFSREEFDTPAHRTLLAQVLAVARRVRKVRENLESIGARKESLDFRTPMMPRLPYRLRLLDELDEGIRRLCKTVPFTAVRGAEVSAAGLNVIAGHPLYAAAYRYAWQARRPGVDGHWDDEMLSLSPTWEIYERWCFLQLTRVLQDVFPTLTWRRHSSGSKADRLIEVGTGNDEKVEVHLQRTFPAMDSKAEGARFHSISGERRPDIVVTYVARSVRRFLVLDPKYSVSRNRVLAAMEAAHIYRDSLRWEGQRPDCTILLVPAPSQAGWLEAAEFVEQNGVGVLPFSPGAGRERLKQLIERLLLD